MLCIQINLFFGVSVQALPFPSQFILSVYDVIMFDYSVITYPRSILRSWLAVTLEVSVSGQKVLAMAREAGADITEAVNKCDASISKERHIEHTYIYWPIICYYKRKSLITCLGNLIIHHFFKQLNCWQCCLWTQMFFMNCVLMAPV